MGKKEIACVAEESFALGDVKKRRFYFSKACRKKRNFHYTAEVMNDFNGYECETGYYKRLENINKFIFNKK